MKDLLLYVRAGEAKHREVNHTLGNLDQGSGPNPFVTVEPCYKNTRYKNTPIKTFSIGVRFPLPRG